MHQFDVIRELYDDFNLDPYDYRARASQNSMPFLEFCREYFLNPLDTELSLNRNKYGLVKWIQYSENSYHKPAQCDSVIWYFEKFDYYLSVELYVDSWDSCDTIPILKRVFPKQITVYVGEDKL